MPDGPVIVACGEALIDLTATGHSGRDWLALPGGSPLNVAVTAGRLGAPVSFVGAVGDDRFGTTLIDHLAGAGVAVDGVVTADAPTTLAVVARGPEGGEPDFSFHVEGTATLDRDALDRLALPAGAGIVHLAGSVSAVLEPAASVFDRMLRASGGRLVSVDPNPRPSIAGRRAGVLSRLRGWLAAADSVKVSVADLAWLQPGDDPLAAATAWLDAGPGLVVVTRGAGGATAVRRGGRVHVAAVAVDVVDTVGAGDAFTGSLLASFAGLGVHDRAALDALDDGQIGTAVERACLVAALTCARAGADPPLAADVARFAG